MTTKDATEKVKFSCRSFSSVDGTAVYHVTSVDRTRDEKRQGYYKACGGSEK
jgi:hypothetical protein